MALITPLTSISRDCGIGSSGQSDHSLSGNSPLASKAWNASSVTNRYVESTNAFSACWPWRVNQSTRGCNIRVSAHDKDGYETLGRRMAEAIIQVLEQYSVKFVRNNFPMRSLLLFISLTAFQTADLDGESAWRTPPATPSVGDYPSIHAAIDANPGRMLYVPAGDHEVSAKIRLRGDRSGLYGPGRIIQNNSELPIVEMENVAGVELRDVTFTRPEGKRETGSEGILAIGCRDLIIENVRVIDNQTRAAAIALRECRGARISHCLVRNYMRVSVDDRTADMNWGYAFNCTDGTGINVSQSTGTLIESNRIIEENLRPTPEIKAQFQLGDWVKKNPMKGRLMSQQAWDAAYTDAWQQGSAIIVTGPEVSDLTSLLGNHIENAAQGIDLHCDHVIVSNNIVVNSFMGMKAMHGSRNVLITGNQFVKNSLWAIGLMPGVASAADNTDGGSIIANNIISDFGYGDAHWIWGSERSPLRFDHGQELDDPPLSDVIIQGNMLHSVGLPRYQYAVRIEGEPNAPRDLHFLGNVFPAGSGGVSNIELKP